MQPVFKEKIGVKLLANSTPARLNAELAYLLAAIDSFL